MEKTIKDYEKFIKKAIAEAKDKPAKEKLQQCHFQMVRNFQHERLVHLIIMLFFIVLTLIVLGIMSFIIVFVPLLMLSIPMGVLSAILVILDIFYIKHYYFLENHIQALYKVMSKF